jgi:AcrR family transcriptional regulator
MTPQQAELDAPVTARHTLPRADGEASRQRLMQAGLRLFAKKGFARTSIRELALAAEVNVAAISYYFGDKAGLYRAVFFEPCGNPADDIARFADPALSLGRCLGRVLPGVSGPAEHG